MRTAISRPVLVDLSQPGTGPFAVIEFGPRDVSGTSSFAVVRQEDRYRWPWFVATNMRWCTAVCAALNATVER